MAAMLTALAHDDVRVIAVDRLPEKLDRARELGAHAAYTPDEVGDLKAEVVIEAVGHPAALETAIALTAPGGRTITVGLPRPDARISLSPLGLVAEGRTLIGSYLGSAVPARDIPRFVELWRAGPAAGRGAGVVDASTSTRSTRAWTSSPTGKRCGRSSSSASAALRTCMMS